MTSPRSVRMEVRCCCQPQKLLGWLPVSREHARRGHVVKFVVRRAGVRVIGSVLCGDFRTEPVALDVIALPVEAYGGHGGYRLALKSEETPLERLRLIPGFVEAPQ